MRSIHDRLHFCSYFAFVQVNCEADLIGFSIENVPVSQCQKSDGSQSAGLHGFCSRAVAKANANFKAKMIQGVAEVAPQPSGSGVTHRTDGEAIGELVRAVREEDLKVHVDLVSALVCCYRYLQFCSFQGKRIPDIDFKSLPCDCYPSSAATDKLASMVAKASWPSVGLHVHCLSSYSQAKKKGISKPFPFAQVLDFMPDCAKSQSEVVDVEEPAPVKEKIGMHGLHCMFLLSWMHVFC